ncbi:nicotinate-nucleotide--dimethylbenzimidazole phosphoribosyltransferase [Dokdonia sp.]|uniref:nicotinate-nucleotide--dimethylbenzimidazole phosphoribosyltransferase n=1 Tax=Dokdonia sp. TaxID=2024995 RepID=UPI003263495B
MNVTITSTKNKELEAKIQHKIDLKTKPIGALGMLENIAFQIGCIQQTVSPKITKPTIVVFAGDHGIAAQGEVNPFPQEVTSQMVYNFAQGGAAINVLSKTNNIDLKVVDAGVNHDFANDLNIINAKVAMGTKNYQDSPAMTPRELEITIRHAEDIVSNLHKEGVNTIGFGEMGIGNTSSASLLMSYFTQIPIGECIGSGTGLDQNGISKKQRILSEVYRNYNIQNPIEALTTFGGFEVAMITGAILKAAELKMTIVIDGFIVTAALLAAHAIQPNVLDYCLFAHTSNEQGHIKMLDFLKVQPILSLGLRLGEGTGAALAIPLLQASVNFLDEMASFESAGVSGETTN